MSKYVDISDMKGPLGIMSVDEDTPSLIPAGTRVESMSISEKKDPIYQRFADEYDIHFIFEDHLPSPDFFTLPVFYILATDSEDGFIGTIKDAFDIEKAIPLYYVSAQKEVFQLSHSSKEILEITKKWKEDLRPSDDLIIYTSKAEAEEELEFVEIPQIVFDDIPFPPNKN